MNSHSDSETES